VPCLKPNEFVHDDIQIFIRKQLVNSAIKYKRVGIIGAVGLIRRIGAKPMSDISAVHTEPFSEDLFDRVTNLFELVFRNCGHLPMCMSFFYDEMVSATFGYSFSLQIMEYMASYPDISLPLLN
jgi:hypothetical protein